MDRSMSELDAVILAAGLARRMGRDKLLLPLGDTTILGAFLAGFPFPQFGRTILVHGDERVAAVAAPYPLICCRNSNPAQGKSGSIRAGLARCRTQGVMFFVADQPLLETTTIHRLIAAYREQPDMIICPASEGRSGNPVIFPPHLHKELCGLQGDEGGRELIARHPELTRTIPCPNPSQFMDIDTPEEYRLLLRVWKERN